MNDFADVDPQFWFDDSQVLIVRAQQPARKNRRSRGPFMAARDLMSVAVFGLAVAGLSTLSASTSDHDVRSFQVANERAPKGLSRRYCEG